MKLVIVDYGMGNLASIQNMVNRVGCEATVTSEPREVEEADKVILPGVGAFDLAMKNIASLHLRDTLEEKVIVAQTPLLGICLGMQILGKKGEEGSLPGLGWLDADVVKFRFAGDSGYRVPHMGWNVVRESRENVLFTGMPDEKRFYFLHSYYLDCRDPGDVVGQTEYGIAFCSAVQHGHIFGVQFHPEKSHKFGLQLLKNFIERV